MANDHKALTDLGITELPDFITERYIAGPTDFIPIYDSVARKFYRIRATALVRPSETFDGSKVLTGDELATRFVWIGDTNNQTFTLADASTVDDKYAIVLVNATSSDFSISIVPFAGNTLNGVATPINLIKGAEAVIARVSTTDYQVEIAG